MNREPPELTAYLQKEALRFGRQLTSGTKKAKQSIQEGRALGLPKMKDIIPEGEKGVAMVKHFIMTPRAAEFEAIRAIVNGVPQMACAPGHYVKLSIKGETMMSDTNHEFVSNREFMRASNGDVLIGGLGLGVILTAILPKDRVKTVTVLEKYPEVIELIEPHLRKYLTEEQNKKLTVIHTDVFTWDPPRGKKWDTIYFDIWPTIGTGNLKEMSTLKKKYAKRLRREGGNSWMGCWMEGHLRYIERKDKKLRRDILGTVGGNPLRPLK